MSARTLLSYLAGHRPYALHRWLRGDQVEPRVAWYPSAGIDLHDLIYLSAEYRHYRPGVRGIEDPPEPTLFLHTESSRDHFQFFAERDVLLHDARTEIRVAHRSSLPPLCLPHHDIGGIHGGQFAGRAIYLQLKVTSDRLGTFPVHLIHVCVENAAFCARILVPNAPCLSHIVQVRYGHGLGGGLAGPAWITRNVARLGAEVFVTDEHHQVTAYNEEVYRLFPELEVPEVDPTAWPVIRGMNYDAWQGYTHVSWLRVPPIVA